MPETRYFGCLGIKGYDSVVKIVDGLWMKSMSEHLIC